MRTRKTTQNSATPRPRRWIGRRLLVPLVLAATFLGLVSNEASLAAAFQERWKVGDKVEVEYLRQKYDGTVTDVTRTGWPKVTFVYDGETRERLFSPGRVTRKSPAATAGASGNEAGAAGRTAEFRTWVNSTGRFKVKAKFVRADDNEVTLEKEDGFIVKLPIEKLSDADQKHVRELVAAEAESNPFAGGERKSPTINTVTVAPGTPIEPDFRSNEISLQTGPWRVTPDSVTPRTASKRNVVFSKSIASKPFHNRRQGFVFSLGGKFAATMLTNAFEDFSELVAIDVENSKAKPNKKIPLKDAIPFAISPSGKVVVTMVKGRGADPGRLDFWNFESGQLTPRATWKIAGFHDRNGFKPERGVLLDENRLITLGKRVAVWDINESTALLSVMTGQKNYTLSANAKQLAIANQQAIWILDVENGDTLGAIDTSALANHERPANIAFSPSGKFLCGTISATGEVMVWDLANGKELQRIAVAGGRVRSARWIDDQYLLIDNDSLLDRTLETIVWKFPIKINNEVEMSSDGRFWNVTDERMIPMKIPAAKLASLKKKIAGKDLRVFKPGVSVALEFELPFNSQERSQIRAHFEEQLEEIGVNVSAQAELKLVAKVKRGKPQTAELSSIVDPFGRRGTQTVRYTPSTGSIILQRGNEALWTKTTHYSIGILSPKGNETVQQAAARACKPTTAFFLSLRLPKTISVLPRSIIENSRRRR